MTGLVDLLEALTIFCFGLSWPISIRKSLISRTAKGKSLFVGRADYCAASVSVFGPKVDVGLGNEDNGRFWVNAAVSLVEYEVGLLKMFVSGRVVVVVANENRGLKGGEVINDNVFASGASREAHVNKVEVESAGDHALVCVAGTGSAAPLGYGRAVVKHGRDGSVFRRGKNFRIGIQTDLNGGNVVVKGEIYNKVANVVVFKVVNSAKLRASAGRGKEELKGLNTFVVGKEVKTRRA